jgi:hypothetical protein
MSLELMEPKLRPLPLYRVRLNRCTCHPETCCCDPWIVIAPDNTRVPGSFYLRLDAELAAARMNSRTDRSDAEVSGD